MQETDSTVRARWDAFLPRYQRLAAAESPDAEELRQLRIEYQAIWRDWKEVVQRKKAGQISDRTDIDKVKTEIGSLAKLHGLPIVFREREWERDETHISRYWVLRVTYAGRREDFEPNRWSKFIALAAEEVAPMKGVVPGVPVESSDEWMPWNRDDEGDGDGLGYRQCADWGIDTLEWEGPDRLPL